jgi:hypothetical protein
VKATLRTVFFDTTLYPAMERLINSDSTVQQFWNAIDLRKREDGDDKFSETSVETRATMYEVQ